MPKCAACFAFDPISSVLAIGGADLADFRSHGQMVTQDIIVMPLGLAPCARHDRFMLLPYSHEIRA